MADAGESTDDDANDVAGDTDAGDAAAEIVMAVAAEAEAAASVIMLVAAAMVLGRERLLIPLMPLIPSAAAAAAAAGVAGSEAGDRGWCPCAESYKAIEWSSSRSKRCASAT
jgi:hypothetical protein